MPSSPAVHGYAPPAQPPKPKKPPFYANLIGGGVAGIVGTSIMFPMDMVKTRLQNQKTGQQLYTGGIDCFQKIVKNEGGVRALYRGLSANLVGVTPEKALKLAVNDLLRQTLQGDKPEIPLLYEVIAGAGAGFCQVIATNPMEIVKIRLQVAGESKQRRGLVEVVRELGIRGLYYGAPATLLRDVPFSMVYFSLYGRIKRYLTDANGNIPISKVFLSSTVAGVIAASAATPMDVIKTRLQVKPKPGDPVYTGIADCFQQILSKEGKKAFFKGVVPRCLIISPLFGIALVVYEFQKKFFFS
jgi:solute carrier family 25 aspartate/glutamate transporter 12/13